MTSPLPSWLRDHNLEKDSKPIYSPVGGGSSATSVGPSVTNSPHIPSCGEIWENKILMVTE